MKKYFIARILRKVRRRSREILSPIAFRCLSSANRRSTHTILGEAPVLVSLTSHGERIDAVFATLETIARGRVRPARIILWLDDADRFENLPASLRRLEARGLEVKLTENLGPHTKYFPALTEVGPGMSLVTADDDILYPRTWLDDLLKAARTYPALVNCHRAKVVRTTEHGVLPYREWDECWGHGEHAAVFATGVSGVIYPQAMVDALRERGLAFRAKSPRADDVWLHAVAVEEGIYVRQVGVASVHYAVTPATQHLGLMHQNVHQSENDNQILATYTPEMIAEITEARRFAG